MDMMNFTSVSIGKRIKKAREKQEYSQKDTGLLLDLDLHEYQAIEDGEVDITLFEAIQISVVLKVSIDEIAGLA